MACTFLTKAEANAVKCSICRSYLSVGPIWIRRNYRPVCGRCTVSSDESKHEAIFYEKVAKYMIFPCRYDVHGCDVQLAWGSVLSHEQSCQLMPIKCAAFRCDDELRLEAMEEHFLNRHPDLIMNKNEFQLPSNIFEKNSHFNKLFIWQNKKYLVQISFYQGACYCRISSFEELNGEIFYDLSVHDLERTGEIHIRGIKMTHYHNKNHDYDQMKRLDYGALSELLSKDLICQFNILGNKASETNHLIEKLLPDLECPVCFQYMRPPIYMCEAGHSICNMCRNKVSKCPSCRKDFKELRNFTLEKVFEHVPYSCIFNQNGCNFRGSTEELVFHEPCCSYFREKSENQTCYYNSVSPCSWMGNVLQFTRHMRDSHGREILKLSSPITLTWNKLMQTTTFTSYDGEIFRVKFDYGRGFKIQVLKVSSLRKREYKFYVHFTNTDDDICILAKECAETILDINCSLIKPFLIRNKLTFTLKIIATH